jgi:hypothetical protein
MISPHWKKTECPSKDKLWFIQTREFIIQHRREMNSQAIKSYGENLNEYCKVRKATDDRIPAS